MRLAAFGALILGVGLAGGAEVAHAERAEQLAVGGVHACIRTPEDALLCWGGNFFGALGDGSTANRATPGPVNGLSGGVLDVALGFTSSCALTPAGVKCWGRNDVGQLGDGTTVNRTSPVSVSGLPAHVQSLASGY